MYADVSALNLQGIRRLLCCAIAIMVMCTAWGQSSSKDGLRKKNTANDTLWITGSVINSYTNQQAMGAKVALIDPTGKIIAETEAGKDFMENIQK